MPRSIFFRPLVPTTVVARRSGLGGWKPLVLSTLPARLAWAAYLRRRVPLRAAKARVPFVARSDRYRPVREAGRQRRFRGGVLVAVAPGERFGLAELIESLRRYEGDEIKVVVVDDLTGEYPDRLMADEFPDVDFVRPRIPAGSRYCAFRTLQAGLLHIVRRYQLPTILKADPDSLFTGSGAFEAAEARFGADRQLGILGTTSRNASGRQTDYRWAGWMAHPEIRWSPRFRRLLRCAQKRAANLEFAQAGAYFLSSEAVRSAVKQELLPFDQPQWSLQVDDVIMGLIIQAAGFRVGSFGGPGEPIASDTDCLPLEPDQLLSGGFKVVHSVRRSPDGMDEDAVRAYFRASRRAQLEP